MPGEKNLQVSIRSAKATEHRPKKSEQKEPSMPWATRSAPRTWNGSWAMWAKAEEANGVSATDREHAPIVASRSTSQAVDG